MSVATHPIQIRGAEFAGARTAASDQPTLLRFLTADFIPSLLQLLPTEAGRTRLAGLVQRARPGEVMVLDHSGPDLAAMQYAAAVKLTMYAGLIAALLNPVDTMADPVRGVAVSVLLMAAVAVAVGCVESLVARLRMRLVPRYLVLATVLAAGSLGAAGWIAGGGA